MIEHKILRALLDKDLYAGTRSLIPTISDGMKPWFNTLDWWHNNKTSSLSLEDLYDIHTKMFNPVATPKQRDLIDATFNIIKEVDVNPEVITTLIQEAHKQNKLGEWAEKLIKLSEGGAAVDMTELAADIHRFDTLTITGNEFPPVIISAEDMLTATEAQAKWVFHNRALREKVTGVGPGVFALVAARPEAGKSLFMISCAFHPEGWAAQGAKIVYLGNEEAIHRTKFRAILCYAGMESNFAKLNPEAFKEAAKAFDERFSNQVVFYHETGMPYTKVAGLIEEHNPDILIIDQLDKLNVPGVDDKLSAVDTIYTNMREYSVKYNNCIFGVSQASDAATGKRVFGYECLEHSRTRKAAELDLIICLGAENLIEDNNVRYINLAKAKVGNGLGNTCTYMVEKQTSRMVS